MVAATEARKLVNSKFPHSPPLYSFLRKEHGLRGGVRSGNGNPLTGRDIAKLPRCPWITVSVKSQLRKINCINNVTNIRVTGSKDYDSGGHW
jgi:hypothetical protein